MAAAGADLQGQAVTRSAGEERDRGEASSCRSASVAEARELSEQLVRPAVVADRWAGASWAQIGAGHGISAEAARRPSGRRARAMAMVRGGGW